MALESPTEWNGQFKLIKEMQPATAGNELVPNIYSREVLFKDPKTQQVFRAFQRNDIDPGYVHQSGRYTGQTNLEVMRNGYAPRTNAGEPVIIHHMGQSAYGPFVEMAEGIHRKQLWHNQFGARQLHPTAPVVRAEFDPIREAYWRSYAESFK